MIPNGVSPLLGAGANSTPQRCVLELPLGTQIGLGRGRQNVRDRVMVEDPLTDFEEVVGGIRPPWTISGRFFQMGS